MKKTKLLSMLLCVMMILTSMSLVGLAADAEAYALTDLIGDFYALRKTGTINATYTAQQWINHPNNVNDTIGTAPLGNTGDAVEIKFKTTVTEGESSSKVTLELKDQNGGRLYMDITGTSVLINNWADEWKDTKNVSFTAEQIARIRNVDVTLLALNKGISYELYTKNADGTYSFLADSGVKRPTSDAGNARFDVANASVYADYITYYDGFTTGSEYHLREEATTFDSGNVSIAPKDGKTLLENTNDFAVMDLDLTTTISNSIQIQMSKSDGARAYLVIGANGANYNTTSGSVALTTDQFDKIKGKHVTLMFVNKGDNFNCYAKAAGNDYYELIGDSVGWGSVNKRYGVYVSEPARCDWIRAYSGTGASVPEDGTLIYTQEFDNTIGGVWNFRPADVAPNKEALIYENGAAKFTTAEDQLHLEGAVLPVGGYTDIKVKIGESSKLLLRTSTGEAGTDFAFYATQSNAQYAGVGIWPAFICGYEASVNNGAWMTYRFARTSESGYTLYAKSEHDMSWRVCYTADVSGRGATGKGIVCQLKSGSALIDSIKIYSPAGEEGLLVTDGEYNTTEVTTDATLSYPGSLRAIVDGKSGSLIFAGYDSAGRFVEAKIYTVDGTTNAAIRTYNAAATSDIAVVKVFLWNDMETLRPIAINARSVKAK